MDAEFVLKNASIIEGSGLAPYKGHIHIVDGEIKAVIKEDSKLPEEKIEIIDLKGNINKFTTKSTINSLKKKYE